MFLCSVASELSNYDSCQSVHFCVLIQLSFCLGGSSRNGGVEGLKKVFGSLRYEKFTNCSQNLSMDGKYAVKLSITELPKISR